MRIWYREVEIIVDQCLFVCCWNVPCMLWTLLRIVWNILWIVQSWLFSILKFWCAFMGMLWHPLSHKCNVVLGLDLKYVYQRNFQNNDELGIYGGSSEKIGKTQYGAHMTSCMTDCYEMFLETSDECHWL